ncbi:MAG TPA: NFACT family protein [Candidatus Avamphibacillus intestinigallinarum]|nr:NFACT family protein [Candidatus Avamphibacillus intestinigallinarum]
MPFDGIVTRAATNELQSKVLPGKINKIYQPTNSELVLTIRSNRQNYNLLLSIHPTYARFHITNEKFVNPEEPPLFCMVLRKHLTASFIESIEQIEMERVVVITLQSKNEIGDITQKQLYIELMGKHSNIILVDGEKNHIIDCMKHIGVSQNRYRTLLPGQPYTLPPSQDKLNPLEVDGDTFISKLDFNQGKIDQQIVQTLSGFSPMAAKELYNRSHLGNIDSYRTAFLHIQEEMKGNQWKPHIVTEPKEDFHVLNMTSHVAIEHEFHSIHEMLDAFYSGKAERDRVKQQAKDLLRFIKNEKDKNKRKLKKHQLTLKKAENKDTYQKQGELLTAHLHLVKTGDQDVTVTDYYDPDAKQLTIALNPQKTPSENAQQFFKTYQKMKTSEQVVQKEILKTEREIDYLDQLAQQIEVAHVEDITDIREELIDEGYMKRKTKDIKKKQRQKRPKIDQFIAKDGTLICLGKNNKQNEYLTMKMAHRNDTWLHTKDIPGSHVVIRSDKPSEETLFEAAQLAAYYSKSQNSSSVPVDYTLVRHVKKPNGSKPGFVTYDNQKTLTVTPTKEVIDALKSRKAN